MNGTIITLDGEHLTLQECTKIANGTAVSISEEAKKKVKTSHAFVLKMANRDEPIYGINTGFGYLAKKKIPPTEIVDLQYNIIRSHASGYGNPLSESETRLAMALRLNVLLQGLSGASLELCEALCQLINHEIYPLIPEYGSVGASGDLAPLAHLALSLIGEGRVRYHNQEMTAADALQRAGLKPYRLKEKEGLALINGTQIMLAVGSLAMVRANQLIDDAELITALSYEGLLAQPKALEPSIHVARRQAGQMESAQLIFLALEGSSLFNSDTKRLRLQDPYSLRCAPQVHGPSRDALTYATSIIERELNAATDNPLVFADEEKILSGGNFHGQSLAMAFDFASIALAELGNISERRLELLFNPHMSGLPAFLTEKQGTHSGYMASQYLSASVVNENKLLANPSCTDSIPGNVGIEDHVSMGMTSARKLRKIVDNLIVILAVEMTAAAQAIDLREGNSLGKGTAKLHKMIRNHIPKLEDDRIISEDIQKAASMLKKGLNQ